MTTDGLTAPEPHLTWNDYRTDFLDFMSDGGIPRCPACSAPVGVVRHFYPPSPSGLFARVVFAPCSHEATLGYQGSQW